jgi:y4mF family transcriptional regulator
MNPIDKIGDVISFHRKRAGLTQMELATLAGIGKTAVFDVEKGKQTVRLNTLTAILDVLNIRIRLEGPLISDWQRQEGEYQS